MPKQFTRKSIEKLFKVQYPEGEIALTGNNYWYCENENSKCINLKCSNLYDVAEQLMLVPKLEIAEMKKAAGYISCK